jgi:endonuclease YncB( thermonuclease family)
MKGPWSPKDAPARYAASAALVAVVAVLVGCTAGEQGRSAPPPTPVVVAVERPADRNDDRAGGARAADPNPCATFDSQVWAQTVYETGRRVDPGLDPDRDGLACEDLPPGPAPALWTARLPAAAEPATLRSTVDGDTISVVADGRQESVRLVGVDTPETGEGSRALECFGPEASEFTAGMLSGVDTVWLEQDVEDRDRYDRLLRYVWFERDGRVYLANEAILRAGAGERFRDTPNRRHVDRLIDAEAFARDHGYGFWSACP